MKRTCDICGKEYDARPRLLRIGQGKTCSRACMGIANRGREHSPEWIAKRVAARKANPNVTILRGADHPRFKNGTTSKHLGYRIVSDGHGKQRFEHRVVMERILGRKLRPDENVHHKNGIKTDNRPENLEVLSHQEHAREHSPHRRRDGGRYA